MISTVLQVLLCVTVFLFWVVLLAACYEE